MFYLLARSDSFQEKGAVIYRLGATSLHS